MIQREADKTTQADVGPREPLWADIGNLLEEKGFPAARPEQPASCPGGADSLRSGRWLL
jgi:hypothetical protein